MRKEEKRDFGHSPAEALFPLFESDKEFNLIKSVLMERFPNQKMNIQMMYKYMASQHVPLIVLFSSTLPYGVVIKKLPPERAWNEVFCNKILCQVHPFDFEITYHEDLSCISERYLPGCDVMELPNILFSDNCYMNYLFYWQGKSAAISYVFGIGDRGHNERLNYLNTSTLLGLFETESSREPIINIDFEYFPSERLLDKKVEVSEIAICFYEVIRQIPPEERKKYKDYYNRFKMGFKAKWKEIQLIWATEKKLICKQLDDLHIRAPMNEFHNLSQKISKRAVTEPESRLFLEAIKIVEKDLNKTKEIEKNSEEN